MSKEDVKNEEVEQEVVEPIQENEEVKEDEYASLDEKFKKEMEEKVAAAEDKYLRTHADFENIKKRLEKEKYQAIDYASEKFAKDLLAPIDTLEMALEAANADLPAEELIEKLKEGIELTIKSFRTTFEKNNIEVVETDEFDPNHHNAVMRVDSDDHKEGEIVQVMQKGYKLKDRLLRPAMVSIAN
jgi:molecular chaperone GrpE